MKLRPGYTSIRQFGAIVAAPAGFPISGVPSLTNFSALGGAPLVLSGSTTDYVAGYRGQLQIATDSGFVTITQNWIFFIDGASWASNSIATGLVTPAGQYWSRWRLLRDNESGTAVTGNDPLNNALSFNADVSAWSNTFTDTIAASVAAFNTVTGTNKNANCTVSGSPALSFLGAAGTGSAPVRTTVQQASAKAQFEVTITTAANFDCGLDDGTVNLNTSIRPGVGNNNAICFFFGNGGNQITIFYNSAGSSQDFVTNTAGTWQAGDIFTFVVDTSAHTAECWRTRSGTTTQMGTTKSGLPTLVGYYGYACSINDAPNLTFNYGRTTYAKAPGAGVAAYWG